uniref:Gamma-glutamylcyclotransferase family protein n=1 Tax=Saccoglossus kowalevskii TaxID=10224 RepID=A0ABM0GTM6_SACKO|nr:PREDICTED: putative gamma-glutamylcyclotransferase CG2811-like [Saccoglossus kowalevskii]
MATKTHRVFVYGTLKRDKPNHFLMSNPENGKSQYIGEARSVDRWPLVIATPFNIPFVLDKKGHGHIIQGELFDIDDEMLKSCDKLEGHPKVYTREHFNVLNMSTGSQDTVWCYLMKNFKDELLNSPMLQKYDREQMNFVVPGERTDSNISSFVKKLN